MSAKPGMLPGIAARDWYVICFAGLGAFFLYIAFVATISFAMWGTLDARTHPIEVYSMLGGFFVFAIGLVVVRIAAGRKTRREFDAGYTTFPFISGTDLRDPRSGQILRRADEYNPDVRVTLSLKWPRKRAGVRRKR